MKQLIPILFLLLSGNLSGQTFTESTPTPFAMIDGETVDLIDLDGQNGPDLLLTGYAGDDEIAKLYRNNGSGGFTEVPNTPFTGVESSVVAFGDVDGQNGIDIFIAGSGADDLVSGLYLNDGAGNFTVVPGTSFPTVIDGAAAFTDVDGQNGLDLLITGNEGFGPITKLYLNNGSGSFTEVENIPFPDVEYSTINFADFDGQPGLDLLISGATGIDTYTMELFLNNGSGVFTKVENTPFPGIEDGGIAVGDIDGQNGLDIVMTGADENTDLAKVFLNNGTGGFTEVVNPGLPAVSDGSTILFDANGLGGPDLLITGTTPEPNVMPLIKIFTNDGDGTFTEVSGLTFSPDNDFPLAAVADVDGQNGADIVITGYNSSDDEGDTRLYLSDTDVSVVNIQQTSARVFPNPTSGLLSFEAIEASQIDVFDQLGRLVHTYTNPGRQINISQLPRGLYVLRLQTEKAILSATVVKE